MKRDKNVMIRLTPAERERLTAALPPGEDLAAFARRTLLTAIDETETDRFRRAAAFIVAALTEHSFEEALVLFDENVALVPQPLVGGP